MEIAALIDALASPAAYPALRPAAVEVLQTHISAVFRLERDVFKVKKPVDLGFVDYSTLERRRRCCAAEVALNRRLAAEVYLGVVPVTCLDGHVMMGGDGEVIDYAVHMRRLPDERTLEAALAQGAVDEAAMAALGRRLAEFHAEAAGGPEIAAYAAAAAVARNCRQNFEQLAALARGAAPPVPGALVERVAAATEAELERRRGLIDARAAAGAARDCHGDLRLDHVYVFPERAPPADLLVIDCIEFNDAFRYSDPIADLAFLVMDLRIHGYAGHAAALCAGYFAASGDAEGAALLPLYVGYRATVRAKVEGMRAAAPEVPAAARAPATASAERHLLRALTEVAPPAGRPGLALIAGLPAAGKSTLAKGLAEAAGFAVIRTDVVRKELAGLDPEARAAAAPGAGIYSAEMTARTYAACLERAGARLRAGERVIVDANLRSDAVRRPFFELADALGVPIVFLVCEVDEATALARLAARVDDASDADARIFRYARAEWEAPAADLAARTVTIDASGPCAATRAAALRALAGVGLVEAEAREAR